MNDEVKQLIKMRETEKRDSSTSCVERRRMRGKHARKRKVYVTEFSTSVNGKQEHLKIYRKENILKVNKVQQGRKQMSEVIFATMSIIWQDFNEREMG